MKFSQTGNYGDTVEILFNDHFVAKRVVLNFTNVSDNVIKAGTPIAADGTVAVTENSVSNAIGILLHDTYADNPNGVVVVHGFIDTAKAKAHSGVTIDDATKDALPMIAFC